MNKRFRLGLMGIFYWISVPGYVMAEDILFMNTTITSPLSNDEQKGFVDIVVSESLRRVGYRMQSVRLPAERALINANAGIDDGDLLRIGGLQKVYPNLIQVPEKIIDMDFVVFTKNKKIPVKSWDSLNPYSIAIVTGWKILERNITRTTELTKVKNIDQLFTILRKGRVDAIVYSRWMGLEYIKQHRANEIIMLEPPLASRGMYVYLHKKHKLLVPKLAAAIRKLKADGSYQRIYKSTLAPLME